MGRTLGPFTDVSTARVDGAYEIYQGEDEEGREVEILTLGTTSSKDPARRALLSDTVAWAHATRGPADAPILSADLNSEQPYVVTLRQTGFRGVERMLERMLAMGPPTGPLLAPTGTHTGQIPAIGYHTNPHGIPAVTGPPSAPPAGSPVAPASPMTSYVTRAQRTRPPWLVPIMAVLLLLVASAGGYLVFYGMSGDADTATENGQVEDDNDNPGSVPGESETDSSIPQWRNDADPAPIMGNATFDADEGENMNAPHWPFAFKLQDGMTCATDENALKCQTESGADNEKLTLDLYLTDCPDSCSDTDRAAIDQKWWQEQMKVSQPEPDDEDSAATSYEADGLAFLVLGHYFSPYYNAAELADTVHVGVLATGPSDRVEQLQQMVNGVYSQAG